ncbi:MAG: aminopeptidase, partial [Clostridiales bacterium]
MTAKTKELMEMLSHSAPCGEEHEYAEFLVQKLKALGFCENIEIDKFNNVIARIPGKNKYTLMLEAHYDEIGLVVTEITENGFLRVLRVGGTDRRTMLASEVIVNGLPGVVCSVPPHLMKP